MHACFFLGDQIEESENTAKGLIIDHHNCHQASNCKGSSDSRLKDSEEEHPWKRHSDVGHVSVVELDHGNILEKVLPERNALFD